MKKYLNDHSHYVNIKKENNNNNNNKIKKNKKIINKFDDYID